MKTYPNQKIVKINKQRVVKNFLQISNENLFAAMKELGGNDLKLYLYLASNCDGFNLALSQAAVEEQAGIPKSSYHRSIKNLIEKGYLVEVQGNILNFFEVPVSKWDSLSEELHTKQSQNGTDGVKMVHECLKMGQESAKMNREIDKIDNIDKKIDNNGLEMEIEKEIAILIKKCCELGVDKKELGAQIRQYKSKEDGVIFLRDYVRDLEEMAV